jgi:hypothetical protein
MDVDVRQLSADLFAQAAALAGGSNETAPVAISPDIISLCESLKTDPPGYVPVQTDPTGMFGFCNVGVLEKTKADGGTIRFGWCIWEFAGVCLTAEFHAVWVDPTGKLVDITPKPDGETRIVFAGDPTYPPDFDFTKRPNNRRSRIYQPVDRTELAQAKIATFSESQLKYETGRATRKGVTLEQWMEARIPIDPLPDLIDAFIRDAAERESLLKLVSTGIVRNTNPQRVNELARNQRRNLGKIGKLIRRA